MSPSNPRNSSHVPLNNMSHGRLSNLLYIFSRATFASEYHLSTITVPVAQSCTMLIPMYIITLLHCHVYRTFLSSHRQHVDHLNAISQSPNPHQRHQQRRPYIFKRGDYPPCSPFPSIQRPSFTAATAQHTHSSTHHLPDYLGGADYEQACAWRLDSWVLRRQEARCEWGRRINGHSQRRTSRMMCTRQSDGQEGIVRGENS
jgi:hypothetical protein